MSIDASGTKYWTGHGGVVLVNDPIETVEEVARAYDIRWLVLEQADTVPAATADPGRRAAPGLGRPPRRWTPTTSRSTRSARPGDDRCTTTADTVRRAGEAGA